MIIFQQYNELIVFVCYRHQTAFVERYFIDGVTLNQLYNFKSVDVKDDLDDLDDFSISYRSCVFNCQTQNCFLSYGIVTEYRLLPIVKTFVKY